MDIKPGVRINGIKPEMLLGVIVANSIFEKHGKEFTLTSVVDSKHSRGSKHYSGNAIDARTRHLSTVEADRLTIAINTALGADFDVVLESTHLHLEYHPKDPY